MAGFFGDSVNRRVGCFRSAALFATEPEKQENLGAKTGRRVEHHVVNCTGARRQKCLVPLIEAGDERSHPQRDCCPYDGPARVVLQSNGGAPGTKKQDAQDSIANDVACFSYEEMPSHEPNRVQTEKEVENWI